MSSLQLRDSARRAFTRRVREQDRRLSSLGLVAWLLSVFIVPVGAGSVQIVAPSVASATNDTKRGTDVILQGGVLDAVTPVCMSSPTIPRGRVFARCNLKNAQGGQLHCVWQGYLVSAGSTLMGPSSTPNLVVEAGWQMEIEVTQSGQGSALTFAFNCNVSPVGMARLGGGYIFTEAPGSGEGERVTTAIAAPAAGQNYATVTVPAKELRRIVGGWFQLVCDATAANRRFRLRFLDATGNIWLSSSHRYQTASETVGYPITTGAPWVSLGDHVAMPVSSAKIKASDQLAFATDNLQAADQWQAGTLVSEIWAVPG